MLISYFSIGHRYNFDAPEIERLKMKIEKLHEPQLFLMFVIMFPFLKKIIPQQIQNYLITETAQNTGEFFKDFIQVRLTIHYFIFF